MIVKETLEGVHRHLRFYRERFRKQYGETLYGNLPEDDHPGKYRRIYDIVISIREKHPEIDLRPPEPDKIIPTDRHVRYLEQELFSVAEFTGENIKVIIASKDAEPLPKASSKN